MADWDAIREEEKRTVRCWHGRLLYDCTHTEHSTPLTTVGRAEAEEHVTYYYHGSAMLETRVTDKEGNYGGSRISHVTCEHRHTDRDEARECGRKLGEAEASRRNAAIDWTDVVFRKWKDHKESDFGDGVVALFPGIDAGSGLVSSFMHVGQHGGADYTGVISRTRPATEEEYAALMRELQTAPYDYKLRVIKRRPGRQ